MRCENSYIHDVSIYGDFNTPNNDGIDIDDSNDTVITRCHIDTGDDAICPKTYTGGLHNLVATNCWIRTKSSAIKLGSASWFEFKNLVFDNITIVDSHRGLALQIRDGGNFLHSFDFLYVMPENSISILQIKKAVNALITSRPNSKGTREFSGCFDVEVPMCFLCSPNNVWLMVP